MRILIANDDGIYSPGLRALAEAAGDFGEVRVVAPDVEQSSTGHAITASRPLTYRPTRIGDLDAFRVNGTPADCVALGCHLWDRVDVVLSGINLGLNIGNGMWHSGTLAAAKQASLLGIRGIALSAPVDRDDEFDFERLKPWIARVLEPVLRAPGSELMNVNFPPGTPEGIRVTRQSVRRYDGKVVPGEDPYGRPHYWFTVVPIEEVEEGTDRWAVQHGYVSVTPLRLDLTDHGSMQRMAPAWEEQEAASR